MTTNSSPDRATIPQGFAPRSGPRPLTRAGTPHQQLDQNSPPALQEVLWSQMLTLSHIHPGRSTIALGDARALHLDRSVALGPTSAFAPDGGTEFAHLHGPGDGSLHVTLPPTLALAAIESGWAEFHPVVLAGWAPPTTVMIYGPRDLDEVAAVFNFVLLSHTFARGLDATRVPSNSSDAHSPQQPTKEKNGELS